MKLMLAIAAALLVSACATSAVPTEKAGAPSEILSVAMTTPAPGAATFVVKRDTGSTGSMCTVRVYVGGKPLAHLRSGQMVTAYLPRGEHIVRAHSTGMCGGGDPEASVRLEPGESKVFRVGWDGNGSLRLGPTSQ